MNDRQDMEALAEVLRAEIGLSPVSVGLTAISHAVGRRLKTLGLDDTGRYRRLLAADRAEILELVEEVVVPETWFFRDRPAFDALTEMAVRGRLPSGPRDTLRLLSLPCSTGEEPYSAAMALQGAGRNDQNCRIMALDVSRRAVTAARRGEYGIRSFRGDDLSFRDRYFQPVNRGWRLAQGLRSMVDFTQANLLTLPPTVTAVRYDVVFIKNLMIYLTPDNQSRAAELVGRLLKPGGVVFVGLAESGILLRHGFTRLGIKGAAAFGLPETAPPGLARPAVRTARGARFAAGTLRPPALRAGRRAVVRPRVNRIGRQAERPLRPQVPAPAPEPDPLARARDLADRGEKEAAARLCRTIIDRGGASAGVFLLMGLLSEDGNDGGAAREWYRKALYLDPKLAEAVFHLALYEERAGNLDRARALRQRLARLPGAGGESDD